MTKKNELDEKQLEGVNGGGIGGTSHGESINQSVARVTCPCGCNKSYTFNKTLQEFSCPL